MTAQWWRPGIGFLTFPKKIGNMLNSHKSQPEQSWQLLHSDIHTRKDILAILNYFWFGTLQRQRLQYTDKNSNTSLSVTHCFTPWIHVGQDRALNFNIESPLNIRKFTSKGLWTTFGVAACTCLFIAGGWLWFSRQSSRTLVRAVWCFSMKSTLPAKESNYNHHCSTLS